MAECFLEVSGIWQSSTTKEGLCRYIAKRFAHGDDYFNLVAYSLAVAGFKPTKERISYLTRRHGRMPSRADFEKLDLQNPEWDEDFRKEDLQDK